MMEHSKFTSRLIRAAVVLFLLIGALPIKASDPGKYGLIFEPTVGTEYRLVDPPMATKTDKVEVVEMFCYGCIHCYNMEARLQAWLKETKGKVSFHRQPAIFFPWMPNVLFKARCTHYAKTYFASEQLGVTEKLSFPLFDAIYVKERDVGNEKNLLEFVTSIGIDRKSFGQVYNSEAVALMVKDAEALTSRHGIDELPTFIVDGRYLTSAGMAGGNDDVLKVVNYLIDKANAERRSVVGHRK